MDVDECILDFSGTFQLITHPHVVPNLYEFLSYVEHKNIF